MTTSLAEIVKQAPAGCRPVDGDSENGVQPLADGQRVHERAGLRVPVDDRHAGDRRKRRGEGDRVHAAAGDVEGDRVDAGGVVGVE